MHCNIEAALDVIDRDYLDPIPSIRPFKYHDHVIACRLGQARVGRSILLTYSCL